MGSGITNSVGSHQGKMEAAAQSDQSLVDCLLSPVEVTLQFDVNSIRTINSPKLLKAAKGSWETAFLHAGRDTF